MSEPNERRWTPEEEVEFWLRLVESWQEGEPDTWLERFEGEGLRYLKFLCTDAFKKAYNAWSMRRLRSLPSDDDIWGEVLIWFARSDKNLVTDIVYGGMEYAGRTRGKGATIQDCLKEIKNRVYKRVTTVVFNDWLKKEVGTKREVERQLEGGQVSLDEQKDGGARTLHEVLSEGGQERLEESVEGREFLALGEKIAFQFFDRDLTERADRVSALFRMIAVRGSVSTLPKEVTAAICEVVGIKDFRRLSEQFRAQMKLLGERIKGSDTTEFTEKEAWALGQIVLERLEERCKEWFFSETRNEGLFTWYEKLTE